MTENHSHMVDATLGQHNDRLIKLEQENERLRTHVNNLETRLGNVERSLAKACNSLGILLLNSKD